MATHSLKGTFDKSSPQNQWRRHCDVIPQINLNKIFYFCLLYTKRHLCAKFEQNRTRNKEVAEMENDIIVTSFLKIAQHFCVWAFLLIPIDVPSFKLIEGQVKELQGVVPNIPPRAENDQKARAG